MKDRFEPLVSQSELTLLTSPEAFNRQIRKNQPASHRGKRPVPLCATFRPACRLENKLSPGSLGTNLFFPSLLPLPPDKLNISSNHILVAEDNLVTQRTLAHMLERLGYQSSCCRTGQEAIALCVGGAFACILMDGYMPEMDGMDAAREIRRLEQGRRRTPIVALTASSPRGEERRYCFAAGMDDVLVKPVRAETLASTLEFWISKAAG